MPAFDGYDSAIIKIKHVIQDLGSAVKKLEGSRDKLQSYLNETNTTGSEFKDFQESDHKVTKLSEDASQIAKKAKSKLQIAFVGSVSAGKSSMINTILNDDILPVAKAETTFCSVAITGTAKSSEWKAHVRDTGKDLECQKDLKELLKFLKGKEEKKKFKIEPSSVIDVLWPIKDCTALVDSVTLYDTPGIGQRDRTTDAVVTLCREVDAIVAVMNIFSPNLQSVLDFVKKVNCTYTYGVFTRLDEFTGCYESDDQKEIKSRYTEDFQKALSECGKVEGAVFFVDSQAIENERESQGKNGFRKFEKKLEKDSTGPIKVDTLKFQLQRILSEANSVSEELIKFIKARKQKLADIVNDTCRKVNDVKDECDLQFKNMEGVLKQSAEQLAKKVQDGEFDAEIARDMEKEGVRERALENYCKRLNSELAKIVKDDKQLKEISLAINNSLKEIEELPVPVSVTVDYIWQEKDFKLDKHFTFNDDNFHSRLTKPSFFYKMLGYGTMAAIGSAVAVAGALPLTLPIAAGLTVGTGVAGPVINRVVPFTDPCKWVKYFWPASQEEITAVQEFVRTKACILQQQKIDLLKETIKKSKDKADATVSKEEKSLKEKLDHVIKGQNFLNNRLGEIEKLKNEFKKMEGEVGTKTPQASHTSATPN